MKQMSLIEMDGFLKGKCIPRDLKVNETNAEYLVRKFAEAEAKISALSEDQQKAIESIKQADSAVKLAHEKFSALAAENAGLKSGAMDEIKVINRGGQAYCVKDGVQVNPMYARGWNDYRAAMFQSGNFRENKNSSTNNFREIAETSTNYPVIPSEVLSAIKKVAKIRADFDDFDGDRRGIGDCLDEAEQELIVTINKYASQLAAEPIAPNDVREQTAIPQVPVTPDGWISCSERMPEDTKMLLAFSQGQIVAAYWNWVMSPIDYKKYRAFTYLSGNILDDVTHWMPLPEPPEQDGE